MYCDVLGACSLVGGVDRSVPMFPKGHAHLAMMMQPSGKASSPGEGTQVAYNQGIMAVTVLWKLYNIYLFV